MIARTEINEINGETTTQQYTTREEAIAADNTDGAGWGMVVREWTEAGMLVREWRSDRNHISIVVIGPSEEATEDRAAAIYAAYTE